MSQYGTPGTNTPGPGSLPPRRWGLLGVNILLLVILLIIILLFFFPRPTATVILTPVSNRLGNTLPVVVQTHILSSVQQDMQSGVPTGSGVTGTSATGTLTFKNYTSVAVTIPAGTLVTAMTGQQVATAKVVVVPRDPIIPGVASVAAYAVKTGESGNIAAMSVNGPCCSNVSSGIYVLNETAFSGGRDEHKGPVVQQSDIDAIVDQLKTSLKQKAFEGIQSQLKPGEQLVDAPQCGEPKVTSNPRVGGSAATFTVAVSLTCSVAAYPTQSAFQQAVDALKKQAAQQLGPDFILVGSIITKVEKVIPGGYGSINLLISATGTWKYQFTASRKQAMAKYIAGKNVDQARSWLLQQSGVKNASILLSGPILSLGRNNTVPDDLGAITISD